MILGFTFAGFTSSYERYDFWSDEASSQESIGIVRSVYPNKTDPMVLNNSVFSLPSNKDELFRIRRIYQNNASFVWAGVFQFAHSTPRRAGTFMSAGIWLVNSSLLGNDLLKLLRELSNTLGETSLNDGAFCRPLAETLPAHGDRLRAMMREASETLHSVGAPRTESFIETAEVFDFTAVRGALESFFASYLLVAASQVGRRDVYFFFSDSVSDVLQNRRATRIVNYWQLIDDEVALQNFTEANDMPRAGLNQVSLVPDNARALDYQPVGGRGELADILNRLKQLDASFKDIRSSQREFRDFSQKISSKVTRLSYLSSSFFLIVFAMLFALGYLLKVHEILLQKW